jgi:Tfp pilus assembly protein PilW
MSNSNKASNQIPKNLLRYKTVAGFSLIELMVAMSLFMIVGGAAIALVRRHMPLFNTAQNQTNLNISLRNAVAQLQMEVVNAGTGFTSAPTAFSPMGATISKAQTPGCNTASTPAVYTTLCFDTLNLISVDNSIPLLSPYGDAGLTTNADTSKGGSIYLSSSDTTVTAANYAAWAALLPKGTELMFVQGGTGIPSISIIVLGANAVPNANSIQITANQGTQTGVACTPKDENGNPVLDANNQPITSVNGTPTPDPNPADIASPANDLLKLYDLAECGRFTASFNPKLDYVVKLIKSASYSVDATNPANPKLIRTSATGTQDVIAEQIIGFTVGAWSSQKVVAGAINPGYSTNPNDFNSDWASVRSLQIQIVARATPNSDNPSTFQNAYDQGSYQVQGISVVVNPRNLNTN